MEEVKDLLRRVRRDTHRTEHEGSVAHSLNYLETACGHQIIETLAAYDGRSLEELQSRFTLMGLGSRMALQQVGAIDLDDSAGPVFRVKVLPFAADLVRGAADAVTHEDVAGDIADIRAEWDRLSKARFTIAVVVDPATAKVPVSLPRSNVVGTIHAKASTITVDQQRGLAAFEVLAESGEALIPDVMVHCELAKLGSVPSPGSQVALDFAVFRPSSSRSGIARLWSGHGKAEVHLDELRKSVSETPGVVFVHVAADDGISAMFSDDTYANGIAQLTAIDGEKVLH